MNLFFDLLPSILLLSVGLAMDSFTVSIVDGLKYKGIKISKIFFIAAVMGIFQGLMPLIGYYLGTTFIDYIKNYDHWVVFTLLLLIGGKMVFDAIKGLRHPEEIIEVAFSYPEVLLQGVATSIDALAVGLTLNTMSMGIYCQGYDCSIFVQVSFIIVITFAFCLVGLYLGKFIIKFLKGKYEIAEIIGGIILISLGIKILCEHIIA